MDSATMSSFFRLPRFHYYIYCPILMHTDDKVSAHDTLIFDKYSLMFIRSTDNNQQLDVL